MWCKLSGEIVGIMESSFLKSYFSKKNKMVVLN